MTGPDPLRSCLATLAAALLQCGTALAGGGLVVEFDGMVSESGFIVCSLYDSPEGFLSRDRQPLRHGKLPIRDGKAIWILEKLDYGNYAISAYHDANDNGELDAGLFGIPKEDFGFSNNARGGFGPPDYEDVEFEFSQSGQRLSIRID